mmetsp:Transcript_5522/g.15866  ORF Transcript_5522/g.15866 Transcript_5522/m.15866 type:complete len:229 (-) Transcript_5522:128-814(-)
MTICFRHTAQHIESLLLSALVNQPQRALLEHKVSQTCDGNGNRAQNDEQTPAVCSVSIKDGSCSGIDVDGSKCPPVVNSKCKLCRFRLVNAFSQGVQWNDNAPNAHAYQKSDKDELPVSLGRRREAAKDQKKNVGGQEGPAASEAICQRAPDETTEEFANEDAHCNQVQFKTVDIGPLIVNGARQEGQQASFYGICSISETAHDEQHILIPPNANLLVHFVNRQRRVF